VCVSLSRNAQAHPICVGAANVRLTVPKCHQKIIGLRGEIKTKDRLVVRRSQYFIFIFFFVFYFFHPLNTHKRAHALERLTDDDNRVLRVLQRLRRGD